ncbi:MAG: alkaline phosphatase family protein [SAR324 cluster bacterium]|nr:alkaline phosphatase family protein [SAR324 cluster bacterium]
MKYLLFLAVALACCTSFAHSDSPKVHKISTEQLRAVFQSEKKNSFFDRLEKRGKLIYGPLYSYGKNQELWVSFGLEMSDSLRWEPEESEEGEVLYLAVGVNRVIGPWYEELAEELDGFEGLHYFKEEVAASRWPQPGQAGKYRVGFGSCLREDLDPKQKIFNNVRKQAPHAFMLIGDAVYNDLPSSFMDTTRMQLDVKYNRQLAIRRFKSFYSQVPLYAIWDDHDFWENNADRKSVSSENLQWSRELFTSIFPNGSYGENGEGIYFKWSLGDVDFLMLDTRWFRSKNKKQMLGKQQNEWLHKQLLTSQATFKILVSSVQWHEKSGKDSWGGFLAERNELFEFIFENRINGVFLLSGDAHHGAAYQLVPSLKNKSYPLIEFTSSAMAVEPKKKNRVETEEVTQLLNVRGKHNFGFLEFDTAADVPYVDLKLYAGSKSKLAKWQNGEPYYRISSNDLKIAKPAPEASDVKESVLDSENNELREESKQDLNTTKKVSQPRTEKHKDSAPMTSKQRTVSRIEKAPVVLNPNAVCPEAPIFKIKRLRERGLSEMEIRKMCYGEP